MWQFFTGWMLAAIFINGADPLVWKKGGRLSWEDFRGRPPREFPAEALSSTGLEYSFKGYRKGDSTIYVYEVKALFFPEKSWVRPGYEGIELLGHEQLHFDITAWHAARLREAFDTVSLQPDPRETISKIYDEVKADLDSVQERYDRETDFSRDLKVQQLWHSRIKAYLNEYY